MGAQNQKIIEHSDKVLSVLYIEDDPADVLLLKTTARGDPDVSYQIESVGTLKAAEDIFKDDPSNKGRYDIILLDLSLPDSSGLNAIIQLGHYNLDTPIIVLTGNDDQQAASEMLSKGAQDYLVKGQYTPELWRRTVRYAIERRQYQQELNSLAHTDSLTQLPNRLFFNKYLDVALKRTNRNQSNLSLLFIDFDQFKHINDTLGHRAGDRFLQAISKRLKEKTRASDFVARLGGDEFGMLVEHEDGKNGEVVHLLEKLQSILSLPVIVGESGESVQSSCSIGVAEHDWSSGKGPETLHHQADVAMYRAKEKGGYCYQFYDQNIENEATTKVGLLRGLSTALEQKEFKLFYQPLIHAEDGRCIGVEALLRWDRGKQGLVSPMDFIPLLEETQKIVEVGEWVVLQACEDYHALLESGVIEKGGHVSVNVSPLQFLRGDIVSIIKNAISISGISPGSLQLEITETLQVEQPEKMIGMLKELKKIGIKIAIDDFGTGYSSMNYLKDMPVDTIKIDKSFILSYFSDTSNQLIVEAMIGLAKKLGKEVVAEGVETKQVAEALASVGCDIFQGFYFSRPEPLNNLIESMG